MKMEPIVSSETSAIRTQTPGNYPKRNNLHLEHGESLRTKHVVVLYVINYTYLYHHIVVLDRYTNSNLVYYKYNGDDEPYDTNIT